LPQKIQKYKISPAKNVGPSSCFRATRDALTGDVPQKSSRREAGGERWRRAEDGRGEGGGGGEGAKEDLREEERSEQRD